MSRQLCHRVLWCVMCNQQCKRCRCDLGSRCTIRHGRSPGRLLDVAATFRSTREGRPIATQGGEVLTEDDVPVDACVAHVVIGFDVATDGSGRDCHTSCIVDDNCHS